MTYEEYRRFSPLVRRIAIGVGNRVRNRVTAAELLSIGWVGMLEALDLARGPVPEVEMQVFVACHVSSAMLDHLRSLGPAPRRLPTFSRALGKAVKELCRKLGRMPSDEELALAIGLSIDDYHTLTGTSAAARELPNIGHARC